MAQQDYSLIFKLVVESAKFNSQIDKAQGKILRFGKDAGRVGRSLSLRLTAPIVAAGGLAIKQAAKFERLRTTMNTLTGSAENGAKAFERLVQFSAETPLQLEELTNVNNMLMGFGQSSDDAFESLKMLGDVAAVSGGNLTGIAVAFGQAAAEGRVMTRDLRQFINNGVPILDILSKSMGVARSEIMEMASEGKITFDILQDGFKFATGPQGRFNDGLKTLSKTLGGLFSTLKDNVNIALAELGHEIARVMNLEEGIPALSEQIKSMVDGFKNLSDGTKELIIQFTGLGAAAGPLAIFFGAVIGGFEKIFGFLKRIRNLLRGPAGVIALITGLVTAFQSVIDKSREVGISSSPVMSPFGDLGSGLGILDVLTSDADKQKKLLDGLQSTINKITAPTGFIGPLNDPSKFSFADTFTPVPQKTIKSLEKVNTVLEITSRGLQDIEIKSDGFKALRVPKQVISDLGLIGAQLIPTIGQALTDGFAAIGEGENPIKRIGKLIGGLITRLLAAAAAAFLLAALLGKSNIGKALGGFSGIFKMLTGIETANFAKGGIVSGPTMAMVGEYPGARSNPEVIAPLNKLKSMIGTGGQALQGEFILRGQDLVVALQRAEKSRKRII